MRVGSPRRRSSATTRLTKDEAARIATGSLQDLVASLHLRLSAGPG